MSFISEDFMLTNETAKRLYHDYAKDLPIFDYHCHLNPELIASNHQFEDITEIWLAGDHYKWRAMRANGVPEEKITGSASSKEKFKAWAETAESTIGNPLYHWTHLELKRYFDIDDLLGKDNWEEIYEKMNAKIKEDKLTTQKLIKDSNVEFIGTTDNPTDSLEFHDQIKESDFDVTVAPSFRPDEAFPVGQQAFLDFLDRLEAIYGTKATTYDEMLALIQKRVDFFDERGTLASDHALEEMIYEESTDEEIDAIFEKALNLETITKKEKEQYLTRILVDLSEMYYEKGWAMQIHFGAIRNNNSFYYDRLGPDTGFDSIKDSGNDAVGLNGLLDKMNQNNRLPKMIIYNLDPTKNDVVASGVANFQVNDEGIKGKVQFGAGWWFNDTEEGMLRQMKVLADHGLLMNFVGMLTDSRSFLSYPRHEYFRRILCNFVGEQVESGKYPNDEKLLKKLIENVCYYNAKKYFKK
ncbi:glucuronate isomerase [Alkalibacterium iburiense]|uniref:Uronate isomerase n=1 Tax=Alkalibacterium iburiense TaxID=290589 RepID=A0ABP3H0L4_9LACT